MPASTSQSPAAESSGTITTTPHPTGHHQALIYPPGEISLFASAHRFFASHPFTAPLLSAPNTCIHLPASLIPKPSTEDSLLATTLHHHDRVAHCLALHPAPGVHESGRPALEQVSVLFSLGAGLNGFPHVLHGGITAALVDEAMGILIALEAERRHLRLVQQGKAHGEIPADSGLALYTRRLGMEYRAPVQTPGVVVVNVRWGREVKGGVVFTAEVRQWVRTEGTGGSRGDGMGWAYGMGEGVDKVVATAEAEFRTPRGSRL